MVQELKNITPSSKFILDATAGYKMMWMNKHHPNTIYLDQRTECKPDIVGDHRELKEFDDETFRLIVFDPPHLIDRWQPKGKHADLAVSYGLLRAETWQSDIKRAFKELFRVLKPYGILLFKWSNHDIPFKRVTPLFPQRPLFGQITSRHINKHGDNKTAWFCFMKIPDGE